MTIQVKKQSHSIDYGKLNTIAQALCLRLDELFGKLEIDLRRSGKMYLGCCPIHGGDNQSAINLYPDGYTAPGTWFCKTHHCEKVFQKTIIGFVRGVLSAKYFGWNEQYPVRNLAPFDKVIDWICKFINQDWNNIHVDKKMVEKCKFIHQVESFKNAYQKPVGVPRSNIVSHLSIPCEYYIQRGFSRETLVAFDVGLCCNKNKEMYNRAVVPFYDETGQYMLGCTARSIFEQCTQCGLYHSNTEVCPDKSQADRFSKWRNSGNTSSVLYNWWNARKHIVSSGKATIVESAGNVWRGYEAGIQNIVGTFGTQLTDEQQILLEKSGAVRLTFIRDNDAAGEKYEQEMKEQFSRMYELRFIVPSAADLGEMSVDRIKKEIIPSL